MIFSKTKIFIIIGIAILFVCLGTIRCMFFKGELSPSFQDRSVTTKTKLFPSISIFHSKDHTYWVTGDFCRKTVQTTKLENGNERIQVMYADGFLVFKENDLHIQDSTIARLRGIQIIPVKIGETRLIISQSEISDTILISVKKEKWGLGISPSQSYRMNEETRR